MKILVLSQYWYPENGVPQRRWTWLTSLLKQLGHEVRVVAPYPHYRVKESQRSSKEFQADQLSHGPNGELIARCGFLDSGSSLSGRILGQAYIALSMITTAWRRKGPLDGFSPDLIIGTVPALPTAWVTEMVARGLKAPYVIDLRDSWPDLLTEHDRWNDGTGKTSMREKLLKRGPFQVLAAIVERVMLRSYRNSAGMITTSNLLREQLSSNPRVVPPNAEKPMETIFNVFPSETVRKNYTVSPGGEINVMYAGTIGRAQMLSNAVEAVALAGENGTKVNLRLIGSGVAVDALKDLAEELNVDVEFIENVKASELGEHYEWADSALVHLANWGPLDSAIPSKTFELMQNRIHISGSIAGESAELIEALGAGDVVYPDDPKALAEMWQRLAANKELLQMGSDALAWVAEERGKRTIEKLSRLLDQIAADRSQR